MVSIFNKLSETKVSGLRNLIHEALLCRCNDAIIEIDARDDIENDCNVTTYLVVLPIENGRVAAGIVTGCDPQMETLQLYETVDAVMRLLETGRHE